MIARILLALVGLVSLTAEAATLIALPNETVVVPVNAELGSILQLPGAVRTITPARHFTISDLGGEFQEGQKRDVRTFQIRPVRGAQPEAVTFVLAGGKTVALKFTPAAGAEKFYDVTLEATATRRSGAGRFLADEMSMMRAMLLDEHGGFAREVTDQKLSSKFDGLEFTLARVYSASELTGYVFRVRNKGKEKQALKLSSLVLGKPNRAVLAQADKPEIEPCPLLKTTPECMTAIRFVVRGKKEREPLLGAAPSTTPPFVKGALEGGAQ